MSKRLSMGLVTILSAATLLSAAVGPVLVNGNPVPGARSEVNIQKQVLEFREGGSNTIHLIPGTVAYRVCIESPDLIAAIEAACAPDAANPFLDVAVEDGRAFDHCLVETSKTFHRQLLRSSKRVTEYCLRCEAPAQ
jgi:hypothetical protein